MPNNCTFLRPHAGQVNWARDRLLRLGCIEFCGWVDGWVGIHLLLSTPGFDSIIEDVNFLDAGGEPVDVDYALSVDGMKKMLEQVLNDEPSFRGVDRCALHVHFVFEYK